MENNPYGFEDQPMGQPPADPDYPDAGLAQILGIFSIPLGCAMPLLGLILGILSFSKSKKGFEDIYTNRQTFSEVSIGKLRTAKVCSTIGLVLSSLHMAVWVFYVIFMVTMSASGKF